VIQPLKKEKEPTVNLEVEAESQAGFDRALLDRTVRAALDQIKAEVQEWEEH